MFPGHQVNKPCHNVCPVPRTVRRIKGVGGQFLNGPSIQCQLNHLQVRHLMCIDLQCRGRYTFLREAFPASRKLQNRAYFIVIVQASCQEWLAGTPICWQLMVCMRSTQWLMDWGSNSEYLWKRSTYGWTQRLKRMIKKLPFIYGKCVNLCYHLSSTNTLTPRHCTHTTKYSFVERKIHATLRYAKTLMYLYYHH